MLLCTKVLFELPVYRLSKEKYMKDYDLFTSKPSHSGMSGSYLLNTFGGEWQYNEIIGYLKFYLSGNSQIRCDYWETSTKIKRKSRKKIFIRNTHSFCKNQINRKSNNKQILKVLEASIQHCISNLPKDRYVDRSIFDSVFRYIDWQSVMT